MIGCVLVCRSGWADSPDVTEEMLIVLHRWHCRVGDWTKQSEERPPSLLELHLHILVILVNPTDNQSQLLGWGSH